MKYISDILKLISSTYDCNVDVVGSIGFFDKNESPKETEVSNINFFGIYLFVNNSNDILYIGIQKGRKPVKRLREHKRTGKFTRKMRSIYLSISGFSGDIITIEHHLMAIFKPKLNRELDQIISHDILIFSPNGHLRNYPSYHPERVNAINLFNKLKYNVKKLDIAL